ncbi:BcsR/BcsP family cellulose biosynthesis protein [Variovorax sp. W2I14]|uniref:BcsR/BcsP family cellulose biosynthesis protein n=1 Tax=Variovorax sp. W2I14 TaxID=3042290 RepID=UPI003D1D083D
MSRDDRSAEDVAGLFRKFGGDAHNYREFSAPEADAQAAGNWPLLSGGPIDRPPVAPPAPAIAPVAPVATAAPAVSIASFAPLIPAVAAATQSAPAPSAGAAPSELQALFARLAEPQRPAAALGPMSRWRRPT